MSLGGHACLDWASPRARARSVKMQFIPEVRLPGNKCRNPDDDPEGPWCFVEVYGNVSVDYCDLQLCGQCISLSVCLPVCLSAYLSVSLSVCLPTFLSACLYTFLSI